MGDFRRTGAEVGANSASGGYMTVNVSGNYEKPKKHHHGGHGAHTDFKKQEHKSDKEYNEFLHKSQKINGDPHHNPTPTSHHHYHHDTKVVTTTPPPPHKEYKVHKEHKEHKEYKEKKDKKEKKDQDKEKGGNWFTKFMDRLESESQHCVLHEHCNHGGTGHHSHSGHSHSHSSGHLTTSTSSYSPSSSHKTHPHSHHTTTSGSSHGHSSSYDNGYKRPGTTLGPSGTDHSSPSTVGATKSSPSVYRSTTTTTKVTTTTPSTSYHSTGHSGKSFCTKCGTKVPVSSSASFCSSCGDRL
ncbi:hypothetical protein DFA_01854 [Cavenderia fasciculata]|uniref:Uncharacterized protein n=1 Tax=Cavenderia fasciculata TaxID=261658 RepID=F4PV60_CACFS|nr:uncharacterized protein DFA_01854 [Cavenderia fasciculata]EGG21968.1 hypothetical protein DFA_01854 [Cavenderia fasciculata]|eukprot:XP_004359819.1 hypothetical protein DFA_01854 [Cavenderia fasciculata]